MLLPACATRHTRRIARVQPSTIVIRSIVEDDWRDYRDIRLKMLAEIPIAFGETLDAARRVSERGWRARASRGTAGGAVRFTAIVESTGEWVGTMGGFLSPEDVNRAVLVGVYVVPDYRGSATGVTDALIARVERWATAFGDSLLLHVHADNSRAIAAYEKRGWKRTGVTIPYALHHSQEEFEMVKSIV